VRAFSVAVLALLMTIAGGAALADDFKIPPTPDHFVTDNASVLTDSTQSSIENELQTYQQQTGHQILVWIGSTTGDVPLETWTGETADHWKAGRKGHDDGAVLFVFMKDRKVRIEVGYGLESALTDADSFHIIQNTILPRVRSGDVNGAISYGVAAILQTITPSFQNVPAPTQPVDGKSMAVLIILSLLFVFAIVVILRTIGGGRGGFFIGSGLGGFGGGGFGGGGFGGGGFSAGGGGFGGGGASGGW